MNVSKIQALWLGSDSSGVTCFVEFRIVCWFGGLEAIWVGFVQMHLTHQPKV